MGNPYLNPNEAIILATHRVVVKAVSSDLILTNQRLLMVDSQNSRFIPVTIPLSAIEVVMGAESRTGEPEITLSIAPPGEDEAAQRLPLTFSQWEGEERMDERDDWLERLKEQILLAQKEAQMPVIVSVGGASPPPVAPVTPPESVVSLSPAISGPERVTCPLSGGFPWPALEKPRRSPVFVVGAIGLLALVIAGAILVLPPLLLGNVPGQGDPALRLTPTTPMTPNPTLTPIITLSPTPLPTPEVSLHTTPAAPHYVPPPKTGVWVHVNYSGNYTISYGTPGRMQAVTSMGEQIYNIPAVNDMVEAEILKSDSSGNLLTVEVYKNGKVVGSKTTSAPQGYIDLHVNLAER
ncbi:MAG: hypothetical protein METHP_02129 [Methanoregula sp. SKADARSKE-2]|nr:MAG: hypothetical protein METHP_02129 [Methanoregula sp. SKADARSKE-2]